MAAIQADLEDASAVNNNDNTASGTDEADEIIPDHYVHCTEEDLNSIAYKTNAESTHVQTKWAVKTLKGEYIS